MRGEARAGIFAAALTLLLAAGAIVADGGEVREVVYIQDLGPDRVVVAWGGPSRRGENTIGEGAPAVGPAELEVAYRDGEPIPGSPFRTETASWLRVSLPRPDADYVYRLRVSGRDWGDAIYRREGLLRFRSFPSPDASPGLVTFLVIGDFGTGDDEQLRLAEAMRRLVDRRETEGAPVRFVVTTGDNLYDQFLFWGTGSDDEEYYRKLFEPYQAVLSRVPFFPSLGNHDGSESEAKEDLDHYRDNFFLPLARRPDGRPSLFPERYYSFGFGATIRLFCLDTTANEETLPGRVWTPLDADEEAPSEQRRWLEAELERWRDVPWRIAFFHHPPYSAGRGHYGRRGRDAKLVALEKRLVPLLDEGGVRVAFAGHVHNFQLTRREPSGPLSRMRFFVSGAGGKSEPGRRGEKGRRILRRERIEATNAVDRPHFLLVEIEDDAMRIVPVTYDEETNEPVPLPVLAAADGRVYRGESGVLRRGLPGRGSPYHPIRIRAAP